MSPKQPLASSLHASNGNSESLSCSSTIADAAATTKATMHNQKLPTLCSLRTFLWILLIEREKKKKLKKLFRRNARRRRKSQQFDTIFYGLGASWEVIPVSESGVPAMATDAAIAKPKWSKLTRNWELGTGFSNMEKSKVMLVSTKLRMAQCGPMIWQIIFDGRVGCHHWIGNCDLYCSSKVVWVTSNEWTSGQS